MKGDNAIVVQKTLLSAFVRQQTASFLNFF